MRRLGRAALWAVVAGAFSAAAGAAIAAVVSAILNRNSTDVIDGVIGVGIVLGALISFVAAFVFRRAQPGKRVSLLFRRWSQNASSEKAVRRRARIREHPVQAPITSGGTWGILFWSISAATDSGARTVTDFLLCLALGLLLFGPLLTWLLLRRDR